MVRMRRPFTPVNNLAYTPTRAHGRSHHPTQSDPISLILQNSGTLVTVANTITETTVFSRTMQSGLIGIDNMLRLTLFCDVLFNNNVADTLTLTVKWGPYSTLIVEANMAPAALSATRRFIQVTILLANRHAIDSQNVSLEALCDVNFATGRPVLLQIAQADVPTWGQHPFSVTFTWSVASVNNSLRVFQGILEKM